MSKKLDRKKKHLLAPRAAAAYLRQLAQALESGVIEAGEFSMRPSGLVKVKETIKGARNQASLKISLKLPTLEVTARSDQGLDLLAQADEAAAEEEEEPAPAEPGRSSSHPVQTARKRGGGVRAVWLRLRPGETAPPWRMRRRVRLVTGPGGLKKTQG